MIQNAKIFVNLKWQIVEHVNSLRSEKIFLEVATYKLPK